MKLLLLFLLMCPPVLSQVGAIPAGVTIVKSGPGNACENSATTGLIKKKFAANQSVALCFDFTGDRSRVNYFRVRQSETPSGPYNQWFRLPNDAIGFTFPMKKPYHYFLTTVGKDETETVVESPGSNHAEVVLQ